MRSRLERCLRFPFLLMTIVIAMQICAGSYCFGILVGFLLPILNFPCSGISYWETKLCAASKKRGGESFIEIRLQHLTLKGPAFVHVFNLVQQFRRWLGLSAPINVALIIAAHSFADATRVYNAAHHADSVGITASISPELGIVIFPAKLPFAGTKLTRRRPELGDARAACLGPSFAVAAKNHYE